MGDHSPGSAERSPTPIGAGRLDSWKEIAAHLKRDVTTVRRWEKRERLPVHRHAHEHRDSVYAYVAEIDRWWEGRRNGFASNGVSESEAPADGGDAPTADRPAQKVAFAQNARPASVLAATFFATTIVLGALLLTQHAGNDGGGAAVERRFAVDPPPGLSFVDVELSPDGRHLAFTASADDAAGTRTALWVQRSDSLQARLLPETDGASLPFWSPAGDALGFFADGHLWTIDLAGGSPRRIAVAPSGRGGTWNGRGTIVFAPARTGGLFRVPSSGGPVAPLTHLAAGTEYVHAWPHFLPDDTHFLYVAHGANQAEDHRVFVGALDGRERRQVLTAGSGALYARGYLFFQKNRKLLAQPFDGQRLEITGHQVELGGPVQDEHAFPRKAVFSVSANGTLAYRTAQSSATRLLWRDRAGRSSTLIDEPADYYDPTFSPDDTRVAYAVFDPTPSDRFGYGPARIRGHIHILDPTTGQTTRLTANPAGEWEPVWSPDGRSIVFASNTRDGTELIVKDPSRPEAAEVALPSVGGSPWPQSWSPDGRFVVYSATDPKTRLDLWLLPMSGNRTPVPLLRSEFVETQGQISPDGRWLAYTSGESGRLEVWVTTFPTPTAKWRISSGGAGDPRWRPDGTELYYVSDDRELKAVPVTPSGTMFQHGRPTPLFDVGARPHWYGARNLYDVSRDGKFLVMAPVEDDRSAPLIVVIDWVPRIRRSR